LEIQPDFAMAQSNLGRAAWVLATSPEASVRNGVKAVALAEQLDRLVGGNNPTVLGTLAAAYAETGRFPKAVETAQRALQLATAQTNTALVNALPGQIGLYQAGRPLRDTSQTATPPPTVKP
jgi:hypothetical protein